MSVAPSVARAEPKESVGAAFEAVSWSAGAVRADQPEDLALFQIEVEILERADFLPARGGEGLVERSGGEQLGVLLASDSSARA